MSVDAVRKYLKELVIDKAISAEYHPGRQTHYRCTPMKTWEGSKQPPLGQVGRGTPRKSREGSPRINGEGYYKVSPIKCPQHEVSPVNSEIKEDRKPCTKKSLRECPDGATEEQKAEWAQIWAGIDAGNYSTGRPNWKRQPVTNAA
jgi:hypothetical protein